MNKCLLDKHFYIHIMNIIIIIIIIIICGCTMFVVTNNRRAYTFMSESSNPYR